MAEKPVPAAKSGELAPEPNVPKEKGGDGETAVADESSHYLTENHTDAEWENHFSSDSGFSGLGGSIDRSQISERLAGLRNVADDTHQTAAAPLVSTHQKKSSKPARREPPKLDWNRVKQDVGGMLGSIDTTTRGTNRTAQKALKCIKPGCNRCRHIDIPQMAAELERLMVENAKLKEELASREGR